MNQALVDAVCEIYTLLVNKDFLEVESRTNGVRLHAMEIQRAVENYGRTITLPPCEIHQLIDAILVRGSSPETWSVVVPLWTMEEGRSDLSIELSIIDCKPVPKVEFDDIHVR